MIRYQFLLRLLLLLVTAIFLARCAPDSSHELAIKIQMCIDKIEQNDDVIFEIKNETLGYYKPSIREIGDEAIQIEKWRSNYQTSKLRGSLLLYSDSVLVRFARLPFFNDTTLVSEIEYYQSQLPSADTLQLLNLFYLTLRAEKRVLDHLHSKVFSPLRINDMLLPLHLGDSVFHVRDTVVAATSVHFANFGMQSQVDLSGVACQNQNTGNVLPFKFLSMENHYMLIFIPIEKGTYHIRGNVLIKHYSEYGTLSLIVSKDFIVK